MKACVLSALERAPSLHPHVLYMHNRTDALTRWMAAHGVAVHLWPRLHFEGPPAETTDTRGNAFHLAGWAKLDVPLLMRKVRAAGDLPPSVHPELVLFTDTDMLFAHDMPLDAIRIRGMAGASGGALSVPYLAAANDQGDAGINSGVLLMNVTRMERQYSALRAYGESRKWRFEMNEQVRAHRRPNHRRERGSIARSAACLMVVSDPDLVCPLPTAPVLCSCSRTDAPEPLLWAAAPQRRQPDHASSRRIQRSHQSPLCPRRRAGLASALWPPRAGVAPPDGGGGAARRALPRAAAALRGGEDLALSGRQARECALLP